MQEDILSDKEFAEYLHKHNWPGPDTGVIKYGHRASLFIGREGVNLAYVEYDNVNCTRRIYLMRGAKHED